ncbi:MAG: PQQ-dependent sugar dehydrogenase [Gammaproteobacteria bacterium]|jgi:glucose/arabinose dehydrogenase
MQSLSTLIKCTATALLAASLCAPAAAQPRRPEPAPLMGGPWDLETETGPIRVSILTNQLESPWSLVFLPSGDMLVTERPGRLRVIRDGELDPHPIGGLPEMFTQSISGLFGLTLHPEFQSNRLIYFAYPKPHEDDDQLLSLAVARARWDGGSDLADVEDIFVANDWYSSAMAAENDRCCGQGPATGSFGGRIEFGPDGLLYLTSGDRNWGEKAQDPQSHLGKILRLNDDGSVPADNPFVGNDAYLPEIYTLGHRNQLGLRFDPATGDLWETEFGPAGGDEVNLIEAGANYGWFVISEGAHYDGAPNELGAGGFEGFVDPVAWWPRGGNPGNIIVYRGDVFPDWQGDVFLATMSGARLQPGLVRLEVGSEGQLQHEERMLTEIGTRMRDVAEGPDGRIYILTESSAFASPGALLVVEPGG